MSFLDVARQRECAAARSSPRPGAGPAAPRISTFPPIPLPEGQPGDVIRAEETDAYLVPGVRIEMPRVADPLPLDGAIGEPTAVSGTVLIPTVAGCGPRPLIGYAVGTHGIGDAAAPSRLLARGREWEAGLIAMVLARGWAVALTDYEGLGTPGDHTYMVGRALGPNVLDAMRAARSLDPEELPMRGPCGDHRLLRGRRGRGVGRAAAADLRAGRAAARGCGGRRAADVEAAGPSLDGSFFSFFIAYGGIGYAAAYPELDLDPYLTLKARAASPDCASRRSSRRCCSAPGGSTPPT